MDQEGENNYNSKLTVEQVHEICELIADELDLSVCAIAKKYKVTDSCIKNIFHKRTWKSITDEYDFSKRIERNKTLRPNLFKVLK